ECVQKKKGLDILVQDILKWFLFSSETRRSVDVLTCGDNEGWMFFRQAHYEARI
ncbi:MAG: hypothetical protein UU08_C0034G0001, partial [Candidatus Uhrbacteria bacterium GW2011_GWE2_40_58]